MRHLKLWLAVCAALLLAAPVQAGLITSKLVNSDGSVDGQAGVRFDAAGGRLFQKKTKGTRTLGISRGFEKDEIDASGEVLTITFDAPVVIESLVLGRLFSIGERGDRVDEEGTLTAVGTGCASGCVFSADGRWSGGGSSSFDATADFGGHGEWTLDDPFSGMQINSLSLRATDLQGLRAGDSDFAFVALDYTDADPLPQVPEPGTAGLLALGLLGLVRTTRP
jgi:hypothetical protein